MAIVFPILSPKVVTFCLEYRKIDVLRPNRCLFLPSKYRTITLPTCFKIIAMHSVCYCCLPFRTRKFLRKGTSFTYFCPPWIRSWVNLAKIKTHHLKGTIGTSLLPSFITIHQAVMEKLKMWKVYRWQTDWLTTPYDYSLWLMWAKMWRHFL